MPIVFQPWVGDRYWEANRFGARVLVLGESHYGTEEEVSPNFTKDVVQNLAIDHRHAFFTKISKVLLGLDSNQWLSDEERSEVWQHLAFYNYVQGFVGDTPRVRPNQDMWQDSKEAFLSVIEHLKPDLVLVLGVELGGAIPSLESNIDVCAIQHPSTGFSYAKWNPVVSEALKRVKS
ncbi:hypothetical protein BZG06_14790 [Salinivibrio kushneri]|uniref:Uracil-DNA glycosylase-like domain-containing protein n=1 Tax=Salinivibrio kushneri TaxID=1908198 RepID=A0AB36K331_9GAMM|nr:MULTISPECIES: hypothetical protein [Salinivibrio]OOE40875.1 hypothetical protein BZG06_14790 [Salinivibrio kushneri]OOE42356.1 hypothetical protein BZG09_13855 [Salinivibrio kushneri]